MYPPVHSAYGKCHSTESALLKVQNDILMDLDSQHVTLLVLLDMSAAFDTVDHGVLLNHLSTSFRGDRHCSGLHPTFSTDHSVCLLTKIYWRSSICTAAFFKDHAQVHCCSPSMPVSFFRLLRTIYHKRTNMQTILSCIYHSMLTRLFRKTIQLSQWSNAYRIYDHG